MKQPWGSQKSGVNITNHDILQHLSMSSGGSRPRFSRSFGRLLLGLPTGVKNGTQDTTLMASVLPVPKAMKKALGVVVVVMFGFGPKNAKNGQPLPPYKNYWTLL